MAAARHTCVCGRFIELIEDKMAQCQKCLRHVHEACMREKNTVDGSKFECLRCFEQEQPPPRSHSRRSTSSAAQARVLLELHRLEEEKSLQEKAAEEKTRREQEFLAKKYALLQAQLEDDDDRTSTRSRRTISSTQKVREWLQGEPTVTTGTGNGNKSIPAGASSRTGNNPKQTQPVPVITPAVSNRPEASSMPAGPALEYHPGRSLAEVSGRNQWRQNVEDIVTPDNHTQNPLDWTFDVGLKPQQPISVQQAGDMQEILERFQSLRLASAGQVQPSTKLADLSQMDPPVTIGTAVEVTGGIPRSTGLSAVVSCTDQMSGLEPPLGSQRKLFATTVSQTCSNYINTHQIKPQNLSLLNVTPNTPMSTPLIAHTNATVTEPYTPPLPPPRTAAEFVPKGASTPRVHFSTPPSVPFGYNCLSPIAAPSPPNVQTVQSNWSPVMSPFTSAPDPSPVVSPFSTIPAPIPVVSLFAPTPDPGPVVPPVVTTPASAPVPSIPTAAAAPVSHPWISMPNSQQLAARHVVPKDLPIFSGDPVEWPLFLSCLQNSTEMCGFSDGENLIRLQRSLKGNALEAVRSFLLHPSSVPMIISTLKTLYGRPDLIVNSLLQKVRATPAPRPDKLETLISFGLVCQNLCGHLRAAGQEAHFSNPALLHELVDKLPANIKLDWAVFKQRCPSEVNLNTFGDYMGQLVIAASDVTTYHHKPEDSHADKHKPKEKQYVHTHSLGGNLSETREQSLDSSNSGEKLNSPRPCVICKETGHKIRECSTFGNYSLENRWKHAQENHLCKRCLNAHGKWPCKYSAICGVEGCQDRHHKLLHPGKPEPTTAVQQPKVTGTVGVHRELQVTTLFRIVPVTLFGSGKSIDTFAFLDEGSSTTLVEARIARELGVSGEVRPLCLQWTNDVERTEADSQLIHLEISGRGSNKRHVLRSAHTVDQLGLPTQSLQFDLLSSQFSYLRGLPVQDYENAIPTVLIGLDNTHLKIPLKIREGKIGQPAASKTRLGWTVYGGVPTPVTKIESCQLHLRTENRNSDDQLHHIVQEFFSIENVGVAIAPQLENSEEKRARNILEETTLRLPSGRFQTGLIWKYDHVVFPDSKPMAERRLVSLERRLQRNPDMYDKVKKQVAEYEAKGYAHKLTQEEMLQSNPNRVWYLPLGVVVNPKKPGKIRLVLDAAAKVQGQSLNSNLLVGPDLLTSLPSVLSQYRQRQVAVSGDLKEMFHQYKIRPQDKQALRFLFRDDPSKPVVIYVMDVGTFGATCSPSSAQFIKNKNAQEFEEQYPKAAHAIVYNHYVDDYLDSLDTVEEAVERAEQVKTVHAKAGFHIRNWLSNSKEVLARVGDPSEEPVKSFKVHNTAVSERILGMSWLPDTDEFAFEGLFREELLPILQGDVIPTKRQMLQVVMSIFDPLGLVSLIVVHGKILLQEVWRSKIGWDEKANDKLFNEWRRWILLLKQLDTVKIPRCYFPGYAPESYDTLELHVFTDASEDAYAAAAYFRIIDRGQVRCTLVSSKTKVAPLKPLSIPRLELQAALLGSRLAKAVEENHTLKINRRFFWTDSSTVLSWLRSDQRKYRPFVAFRVAEIAESTELNEWRWVPTRSNVADDATKWKDMPSLNNESRWYQGPEFLHLSPDMWPEQRDTSQETIEELRPVHVHHVAVFEQVIVFGRFSKWERCLRAVAYVHRFIYQLRRKIRNEATDRPEWLTREELQQAEATIWRFAQSEVFADEITTLQQNKHLPPGQQQQLEKTSKLYKLSPFLDDQDVVRMESRIAGFADASYDFKCPVLLPKNHYATMLIVDWYHRQYKHCNGETAVNEMRQKYHLSEMRVSFRKIRKTCMWCKVYKAVPKTPRMAPLPDARVTPNVRAFTNVGLDYFGPILIKQGRKEVKRWVALFTCLSVRAIHLEVVACLSMESCKMAIRRFIARRGAPAEIYSDRGTNFVGLSSELREQTRSINEGLAPTFTNTTTQWRFNPPVAPHMGGSWERMVRSVKCALASLSLERKPDEETFVTLLTEAEAMVNSRPLTYMPIESADHEALTPNCFLMLSTSGVNQPARKLVDEGSAIQNRWKSCQYLLDQFWTRWVKEYLPTITKRTKWFTDTKPVQAGDLVVIVEDGLRNGWRRGQVLRVYPGGDGRCRSADVQTSSGVLRRPVAKLAVLEVAGTAGVDSAQYGSGDVQDGAN